MELTNELFDKLQQLSQTVLSDSEREHCRQELQRIITYTDILNEVDTENVEPLVHLFTQSCVLREDEVGVSLCVHSALSNSQKTADGCFAVPKAVGEVTE